MRTLAIVAIGLVIAACGGRSPTVPIPPTPMSPVQGSSGFINLSPGASILVPALVEDTVRATDEVCFRNWDARGRCRFFTVRAPANGRLTLKLRWDGSTEAMDVFYIVNGLATWAEGGGLVLNMTANEDLFVFVMSYAAPQNFTLETSLQP